MSTRYTLQPTTSPMTLNWFGHATSHPKKWATKVTQNSSLGNYANLDGKTQNSVSEIFAQQLQGAQYPDQASGSHTEMSTLQHLQGNFCSTTTRCSSTQIDPLAIIRKRAPFSTWKYLQGSSVRKHVRLYKGTCIKNLKIGVTCQSLYQKEFTRWTKRKWWPTRWSRSQKAHCSDFTESLSAGLRAKLVNQPRRLNRAGMIISRTGLTY